MSLAPRLDLRQSQTLIMTPQLQQAIKLLQLSNIELTAFVEQEIEQNPLLEKGDPEAERPPAETPEDGPSDAIVDARLEAASEGEAGSSDELASIDLNQNEDVLSSQTEGALDVDYDNTWNNDSITDGPGPGPGGDHVSSSSSQSGGGFDSMDSSLEQTLAEEESLRDHLLSQLTMDIQDPAQRLIGVQLIDMLDEAGYLSITVEQVAETLGCEVEQAEQVLAKLQKFSPAGIFARSLKECLALQLAEKDRLDPAMEIFLENLELLGKRDLKQLSKLCRVDMEDIMDMVSEIKELSPKPALAFDHVVVQTVIPDVLMRNNPMGGWILELNPESLPRVLVNNQYYAEISALKASKQDKQYISECYQTANWLVKSLHQRATTILKVATEIVKQQDGFFKKGVSHLKPLILRDIATEIEMHESTVSRVTSNKYMATSRGIYELKYFFTTSIGSTTGSDGHSSEAVRHRIKNLIDNEAPKKILSDDKIVAHLKQEGIDIARRTVAKYREAMGISSSVQRRREKAHLA
ncbi:MAG: RNA polymerase factor sigma-54 [Rhodospirillales bacterium]|nr:RNA polymerase factor sigma-54 [Rhodospirillales bacterium]